MKMSTGIASAVHRKASRRPLTRRSAQYSAASVPREPTIPEITRDTKLDPKTRRKIAWK